jgi:hypothetical protein
LPAGVPVELTPLPPQAESIRAAMRGAAQRVC